MKYRLIKIVVIVVIVVIIATIVSPFLLTRNSFFLGLDFTGTGQIGDTIGGITAPIVGLASILLLYITLREQQNYNIQQKIDNRINHLLAVQNDLNALNNNVSYMYRSEGHETQGKGLLPLIHLSHTNNRIEFSYYEFDGLFRACIIARIMCQQLKKLSFDLDKKNSTLFYDISNAYLSSLLQFLKFIACGSHIVGSIQNYYADDAYESEIASLLGKINSEVGVLESELKS